MTNEQFTQEPPPAVPPGPRQLRRFRRSRTDRVLTGVCGGLGEATGVDPVVYRVLLAVLTFFGGAGLLIYGACWVLMPEADRDTSLADEALARGREKSPKARLVLAIALSIGVLAVLGAIGHDSQTGLLVALFALAVVLLTRRQSGPATDSAAAPGGWSLEKPARAADPAPGPVAYAPPPPPPAWTPGPPPSPAPTRERSILGRLTFGLALVGLGVLAAVDVAGADIAAAAYPALVLTVAGLGLLLGTVLGRARGLIALGVLAALALPPAAFADAFDGDWTGGDRLVRPTDAASIQPVYSYGAGRIRFDLTDVDFAGSDVRTRVELGAGDLEITVPPNVDVNVDLDLGIGDATLFDAHGSGLGVGRSRGDTGIDGSGGGTLHLRVDQGIGRVEVRRATA